MTQKSLHSDDEVLQFIYKVAMEDEMYGTPKTHEPKTPDFLIDDGKEKHIRLDDPTLGPQGPKGTGIEDLRRAKMRGLAHDSATRKETPMFEGVIKYFPDALAEVAQLSKSGNDKHNPGQPLQWSKHLSNDHADCIVRHLCRKGEIDPGSGLSETVAIAWRALALLQIEIEEHNKCLAPISDAPSVE